MNEKKPNQLFIETDHWIRKKNYRSYDPSDICSIPFFFFLKRMQLSNKYLKKLISPFFIVANNNESTLRKIFNIKEKVFPQAQAMIARAYFSYYQSTGNKQYLNDGLEILNSLNNNSLSYEGHCCWGQPYNWPSKVTMPMNTPRATVTSQVIQAFLDGYNITHNSKYQNITIDACRFFIEGLNWNKDKEGDICFSYTVRDNYHVHNSNMLVASALIRTWYYSKINEFKEFGIKAANFTAKHQNNNGSWNYWAPPDPLKGKIDNYHTGFVLESYGIIKKYLENEFTYDQNLLKGAQFYLDHFFHKGKIPKMTPKKIYHIDIQSCAQSLITLAELKDLLPSAQQKMLAIFKWIKKEMYNPDGFFYYRIYKNGKKDKTPYMRWGQSWMLRALTNF